MKAGILAPLLASGVSARALLDARANVGVANGQICPAARADTILIQSVYYSEFIPYNTAIDPFRNGNTITISNAPTPIITYSAFTTTILGGTQTIQPTNAPTTSATGSTSTGSTSVSATPSVTAAPLFIGSGVSPGFVNNGPNPPDFFILAYQAAVPGSKVKREVAKRQNSDSSVATANPVIAVDLSSGDINQFAVDAPQCDQATPLVLINNALADNQGALAKFVGAKQAVLGNLINPGANVVNATITLRDGQLYWSSVDGVGSAEFYDCPDGLWAGFPTLDATKAALCVPVRAGAIAGSACSAFVAQSRAVSPFFTRPNVPGFVATTSSTAASTTGTVSSGSNGSSTGAAASTTAASVSNSQASSASASSATAASVSNSQASSAAAASTTASVQSSATLGSATGATTVVGSSSLVIVSSGSTSASGSSTTVIIVTSASSTVVSSTSAVTTTTTSA
jgi:hypothetical protein